ncbi:hypothetical protein Q2T41_12975 [Maribacter confluentis]|uniref:Uncharacterized protein n=1 Tax=Maribacter confluentis TaxID=1656093 RepID=A0ABT8RSI5_9FLAO|nr:hypothetical protein [Maribacter confluentis]MDO1513568.1 hypothetical protein [Maribacter confluentis]
MGNADPIAYINNYPGRCFFSWHTKDDMEFGTIVKVNFINLFSYVKKPALDIMWPKLKNTILTPCSVLKWEMNSYIIQT